MSADDLFTQSEQIDADPVATPEQKLSMWRMFAESAEVSDPRRTQAIQQYMYWCGVAGKKPDSLSGAQHRTTTPSSSHHPTPRTSIRGNAQAQAPASPAINGQLLGTIVIVGMFIVFYIFKQGIFENRGGTALFDDGASTVRALMECVVAEDAGCASRYVDSRDNVMEFVRVSGFGVVDSFSEITSVGTVSYIDQQTGQQVKATKYHISVVGKVPDFNGSTRYQAGFLTASVAHDTGKVIFFDWDAH